LYFSDFSSLPSGVFQIFLLHFFLLRRFQTHLCLGLFQSHELMAYFVHIAQRKQQNELAGVLG
jgi:hypothetical protein